MKAYLLNYFYQTGHHTYDITKKEPPNDYSHRSGLMLVNAENLEAAKDKLRKDILKNCSDRYRNTEWALKEDEIIIETLTIE